MLDTNTQSGSELSKDSAQPTTARAFIQLPSDTRGPLSGYTADALHVSRATWLIGPLDEAERSEFLAAFATTLFRYTQQENITIDVFVPASDSADPHAPLRRFTLDLAINAARSFSSLISSTATALVPVVGAGIEPGSNVAVSFVRAGLAPAEVAALTIVAAKPYDLHVFVIGVAAPAPLVFAYNTEGYREATVARLAKSYVTLHAAARAGHSTLLHDLPVLDSDDIFAMLASWESGTAAYPQEPVHHLFKAWVRRQPAAIAATFQNEKLSYAELDARSNRLAHHLIAIGVGLEMPVAVCVQPSLDVLVAFLAIWKTGAVYVPLDPTHPEALIGYILDEAQPALVLTQSKVRALTQPDRFRQFCFDTDAGLLEAMSTAAPPVPGDLDRACYLLYTSGTTGKPKGVRARHRNLAHYINVAQQMYGFSSADVFCSMARYTFSISMFELVSPLVCGGSLRLFERDEVLAPDRLTRHLHDVTVLHAGPSLLGNLFRYLRTNPPAPGAFAGLRHVSSGGDLVPPSVQEEMKQVFPNAELFVIYGCTEISVMGCTYPIRRDTRVIASFVGKAFPDTVVRVVDPQHKLVPIGVVGEICFAGNGVVEGYLNRPELNAEKFIELDGLRFYATGDIGRMHADGNLEILGRRDYQIQLRGIRVELAGIENTVRELGLAATCAVAVKKLDEQDVRLIAFVVKPQPEVATIATFRRALAAQLPDYMLPQGMVVVDALPLTANGKLDRNKLNELPWENKTEGGKTGPRNAVERQIAAAFASALGVAEVGIDDDFFDLGGHSLLAVSVIQDVENKLGLTLPPGVLFERTTVRGMAELAQSSFNSGEQRPLLLAGQGDKPALFMLLGVHLYRPLALCLQSEYSVYGVYAGRELVMFEQSGEAPPVKELAREYIEIIRRQQPHGPYRLGGISFGGIVAYEVVQQLIAAGEQVTFLCLLDAVLPEPGWRGRISKARRLARLPRRTIYRAISNQIFNRLRIGGPVRSEFVKYGSDDRLGALEERRQEAYRRAARNYVSSIRSFAGDSIVIVSGRRIARDPMQNPDCGWSQHIPNVSVHLVDADHIGLVEEPKVREVAEIFREGLRRIDPQAYHSLRPVPRRSIPNALV